ncbi:MAG: F0F1 ATP synthase subunit A [Bacteroidota bacterium]
MGNKTNVFLAVLFVLVMAVLAGSLLTGHSKEYTEVEGTKFDPTETIMHHIGDANEFELWHGFTVPLPCIAYSKDDGLAMFMSSTLHRHEDHHHSGEEDQPKDEHDHDDHAEHDHGKEGDAHADDEHAHHGHGHAVAGYAYKGYVMDHGILKRVKGDIPQEKVEVEINHGEVTYNGKHYNLEIASQLAGVTSWYDFSITKNVFTMLLAGTIMLFLFLGIARQYKKREKHAPKGAQSLIEPIFLFMEQEVIKPVVGPKYYKYTPYLMTLFFFIWICNLLGLIPFFPGSGNVMGNISVTLTLAVFTFLVSTAVSNAHFWSHMLWMPGVPVLLKPFIGAIELVGVLIIKPASLMIRLFANITAGHIVILSLISLIFVFSSQNGVPGVNAGGGIVGSVVAFVFVMFMNLIELLVAALQAFIFVVLSALYIGTAIEEPHHDHAH